MSTTPQRQINGASVNQIMRKRNSLPVAMVGKKVVFTVQGDGNIIDVLDREGKVVLSTIKGQEGIVLQKKIFNLKANSELALRNERTIGYLKDGAIAEKAGDADKAHELFNNFLNATQVSFGIILPSAIADALGNGVDIAATVIQVDTPNGSLLTIDPSTIMVKQPEVLDHGTSFDVAAFLGAPANEPATDQFDGMDREALKAYAKKNPALGVKVMTGTTDDAIRTALRAALLATEEA